MVVVLPLMGTCTPVAGGEPSAMQSYYYFVHWMSVNRPDLASQQFTDSAIVVAGPACTPARPCIGRAAIRTGYLGDLLARRVSLPIHEQRLAGQILRASGKRVGEGDCRQRSVYVLAFEGGRIASLKVDRDAGGACPPVD